MRCLSGVSFTLLRQWGHCDGGQALDQFDLLGAMVNWVRKEQLLRP